MEKELINKFQLSKQLTDAYNKICKELNNTSEQIYKLRNENSKINKDYIYNLQQREAHLQKLSDNLWDTIELLYWFTEGV